MKVLEYSDNIKQREHQAHIKLQTSKNQNKRDSATLSNPLVKIETQNLNKIQEDPVTNYLTTLQKLSIISNQTKMFKDSYEKYIIESYYNKVIIKLQGF